ncbi:MAG: hypothetical protein QMC17_04145 [Paracoccaceae bacterium]|jgi:hypothetical protein
MANGLPDKTAARTTSPAPKPRKAPQATLGPQAAPLGEPLVKAVKDQSLTKRTLLFSIAITGFLSALLSGSAGFGVAYYLLNTKTAPEVSESQINLVAHDLQLLTQKFSALPDLKPQILVLEERLDDITSQPKGPDTETRKTLEGLAQGLAELKITVAQGQSLTDQAQAALDVATKQALEKIAAALPSNDQIMSKSQELSRLSQARLALANLQRAFDAGQSFSAPLAQIGAAGFDTAALGSFAASGVRSLAELEDSFVPAAREALKITLQPAPDQSLSEKLMGFLRAQSGARALSPQQGLDPDAILSRAQEAVRQDRLAGALDEIALLSLKGQSAMMSWVDKARAHLTAQAALSDLATHLAQK